ncbi:MAG: type II toxin-antitoxin system RelE/ParE family toxin [Nanoarchaeota archaeon]
MFEIEFSSFAVKFLERADKIVRKRVFIKLEKLSVDPFPTDAKRIVGRTEKVFRIRIGDYRILYVVDYDQNKILISDIDKRSKVYQD